jgi:hypothetical protein
MELVFIYHCTITNNIGKNDFFGIMGILTFRILQLQIQSRTILNVVLNRLPQSAAEPLE